MKPHKPVTTSTIGRWIVSVLTASGVGAQFRAHSTRSAPVYQAIRAGIPVDTIYKQQVGVQSLYYQKKAQVEPKNLTKAVLSSEYTVASGDSHVTLNRTSCSQISQSVLLASCIVYLCPAFIYSVVYRVITNFYTKLVTRREFSYARYDY